jgi:Fur family ferric uptake transcriptional regulator/Fur family peroxide stress response transcriptional regulator
MMETAEETLSRALRERGQRVTPQRLGIARLLAERPGHATAERVHEDLRERLPGVSLPTVYATLELLDELGLVRRIPTEGGALVYDTRTHDHHHLVCKRCGAIADVDAPVDRRQVLAAAAASGFAADDAQVVVRGLCAACATEADAR